MLIDVDREAREVALKRRKGAMRDVLGMEPEPESTPETDERSVLKEDDKPIE